MSEIVQCRLCETKYPVNVTDKSDRSRNSNRNRRDALVKHLRAEHKVNTEDANVVNHLLLMHEDVVNRQSWTKQKKRSLSQEITSHKENISPIKPRTPLGERSVNVLPHLPKTRARDMTWSTPTKPVSTVTMTDDQVELACSPLQDRCPPLILEHGDTCPQSPICVISSVSSAEMLSSSLLEEHKDNVTASCQDVVNTTDNQNKSLNNSLNDSKNNSGLDSSWLSSNNYEVLNMRRLKTTAEHGR